MKIQLPVYFTAGTPLQERAGLCAQVDKVAFMRGVDAPPDRPYPFVYTITVRNHSTESVTIKGRKWVVTDASGRCHVTEGDGVVGRFPRLAPGESFRYDSYHVVSEDSRAEGSFLATDDAGNPLLVRIPAFAMNIPR
jgi:ApaG protein